MPTRRINEIVHGKRVVTPDTALRLGRYFGVSAEFWVNLQAHYDLELQRDKLDRVLMIEIKVFATDRKNKAARQ